LPYASPSLALLSLKAIRASAIWGDATKQDVVQVLAAAPVDVTKRASKALSVMPVCATKRMPIIRHVMPVSATKRVPLIRHAVPDIAAKKGRRVLYHVVQGLVTNTQSRVIYRTRLFLPKIGRA